MEKGKKVTRRAFIQNTMKGTGGLVVFPFIRKSITSRASAFVNKSRVVVVKDDSIFSGFTIDQDVVQTMIDAGIRALTGINDAGEAWKSLLPGITQSSVIGIKANCIARQGLNGLATHPEFAYSIAALNSLAPIMDKQVINICDAIHGIVSGGPMGMPQVTPKSLIFRIIPIPSTCRPRSLTVFINLPM